MKIQIKYISKFFFNILIILIITFFLIEIFTRILIVRLPLNILYQFNQDIRSEAVSKMGLKSMKDFNQFIRDDGGPPLLLYKPNTKIDEKWEDAGSENIKTLDENGFCNDNSLYQNNSFDIIVLGDSFTWCIGVSPSNTFTSLIKQKNNLSSYNISKPGLGTYEYIQLLKKFGLSKKPKYVFLNIYEGNDLRDAIAYYAHIYPNSSTLDDSINKLNENLSKKSFIFSKLYSFNLIRALYREYLLPILKDKDEKFFFKKFSLSISHANNSRNFKYNFLFDNKVVNFNYGNRDLDETNSAIIVNQNPLFLNLFDEALLNFKNLSIKYNFIPVVTYIPGAYTAYNKFVNFHDGSLLKIMKNFSLIQRNYFFNKTKDLNLNFIDFTESFNNYSEINQEKNLLYFPTNRHLTVFGHNLIADEIISEIF